MGHWQRISPLRFLSLAANGLPYLPRQSPSVVRVCNHDDCGYREYNRGDYQGFLFCFHRKMVGNIIPDVFTGAEPACLILLCKMTQSSLRDCANPF